MSLETEGAVMERRDPIEQPAAVLVLAAFQNTPWERVLQRATQETPNDAIDVFKGMTGLYWAYAQDLPTAQYFETPTKALLSSLIEHGRGRGAYYDPKELLQIADHVQGFIGMWTGIQSEKITSRRALKHLVEALHDDASRRLDTLEYPHEIFEPMLQEIVYERLGVTEETTDVPIEYKALSRHFTNSPDAPPTTVPSRVLEKTLTRMRTRYASIVKLAEYPHNPEGQQLMWEILGTSARSSVRSVRELLLSANPEDQEIMQAHIAAELGALTNPDLNEKLRRRPAKFAVSQLVAVHQKETQGGDDGQAEQNEQRAEQDEDTEADTADLIDEVEEQIDLWELVSAIKGGDTAGREAFGTLYAETHSIIYSYIYAHVREPAVAEDLTSRVYERALKSIEKIENHGKRVIGWLITVARNQTADYFGSAAQRREQLTDEMPISMSSADAGYGLTSEWRNPEAAVVHSVQETGLRAALYEAIRQMPIKKQQECVIYRFIEGRTVTQTAEAMQMEESAIKSLQFRAMGSLRTILKRNHPNITDFLTDER